MATMTAPPPSPVHILQPSSSSSTSQSYVAPADGTFAFARLHDSICLVSLDRDSAQSAFMTPVDVQIFRHEFGTMFRHSHGASVHPNDIHVLIPIDHRQMLCEESGVVFVARDVTDKLLKLTTPRRPTTPRTRRRY